jgi:putative membrane protein
MADFVRLAGRNPTWRFRMLQAYAYALYLLTGFVLLAIFFAIYTRVTSFDELHLIRKGNMAAALTLGGALIGFCLTLASSILHNGTYMMFLVWAVGAMIVQVFCYIIMARGVPDICHEIENNNLAMGALMAVSSLTIGIINAACIS